MTEVLCTDCRKLVCAKCRKQLENLSDPSAKELHRRANAQKKALTEYLKTLSAITGEKS
jgi:cytidine deaminase